MFMDKYIKEKNLIQGLIVLDLKLFHGLYDIFKTNWF